MPDDLAGRCALVTGSTGGLGRAVAEALARSGCRVVLHGLEPEDEMDARCRALEAEHGTEALYVRADLAHESGVAALVGAACARFGTVDVLVNNAVTRHFAPVEEFPTDLWDRGLAVNVSAPFHAVRLLLPAMRARGWGRIVNMASVYGMRGTAGRVDYVTSKAALLGLTRAVAMETVEAGITCNAVCPGSVSTPGTEARVERLMREDGLSRDAAVRRFLAGKQPSGRFVEAGSIAAAVLFLCGEAGRDITGAVLPVEGGWLAS
jgi:3-hydroxybutyrate dehydrogenase